MIRAFVAIELPEVLVRHLEEVSRQLRQLGLQGSFVAPRSIHLTIKFLGDIEETQPVGLGQTRRTGRTSQTSRTGRTGDSRAVSERLQDCCRIAPFELEAGGLGAFPHLGRPRVVWMGIKPSPALQELHSCLESGLAREGFEPDNRPFHPHLTLLRLKSQQNVPELAGFIARAPRQSLPFGVEAVHLYRSILHPQGARYLKLFTAPLKMLEGEQSTEAVF